MSQRKARLLSLLAWGAVLILLATVVSLTEIKRKDMSTNLVDRLIYQRDPRTGLCFAFGDNAVMNFVLVPCESMPKEK